MTTDINTLQKPEKKPKESEARINTQQAQTSQNDAHMPHERDESHHSQSSEPRKIMQQAHEDLAQGQVDTDLRGTRGVEALKQPVAPPGQKSVGENISGASKIINNYPKR